MEKGKVKFIRKNGKVIPIKDKTGGSQKSGGYKKSVAKTAAGGAVGTVAGALLGKKFSKVGIGVGAFAGAVAGIAAFGGDQRRMDSNREKAREKYEERKYVKRQKKLANT
jgi:uncharacterized membrane protein